MFKKSPFLKISSFFIAILIINFIYDKTKTLEEEFKQTTYQIKENKLIGHQTTKKEIEDYKLAIKKEKTKRKPASQEEKTKIKDQDSQSPVYSQVWKNKLANNLLRFQAPKTKLFIFEQQIKSLRHKDATTVIIYFRGPKAVSSYTAEIDIKTGKILATWGRTIHESPINDITFRL